MESFGEMNDESDDKDGQEDDEKKFGTANPKSDANYELFDKQADESQKQVVDADDDDDELVELRRRQRSLKQNLQKMLGDDIQTNEVSKSSNKFTDVS